ncbi:hypothetical protein DFJ58DRAFT_798348, partial [Suillus subalutaceus]|uniref:uncharacterized protein n=1 Tax=Suillus subalutaceus TaxID=48586 RepID=UPI001B870FDE
GKKTTRGVKGRWVPDKRTNPRKSVQSSPTKLPTNLKQPSEDLMHRFSQEFHVGHEELGSINPMRLPKARGKKKRMTMTSQIQPPMSKLVYLPSLSIVPASTAPYDDLSHLLIRSYKIMFIQASYIQACRQSSWIERRAQSRACRLIRLVVVYWYCAINYILTLLA